MTSLSIVVIVLSNAITVILMVIVLSVPLYFDISLYSCFDLSKLTILYLLVFLGSLLWCLKFEKFRIRGIGVAVMGLLGATALSTIFSVHPYVSLVGTHKRYGGLVSLCVYVLLFFMVVRFVSRRRVESFVSVIILSAVVSSVFGLWQAIDAKYGLGFMHWSTDFGFEYRVASTFGHPAFFSAFLIMVIPLVLVRLVERKWLYIPILCLLLYSLYETKTRASYIGLFVSVLLFCWLVRGRFVSFSRVCVVFLVIMGALVFSGSSSILTRFSEEVEGGKLSGTALNRWFQYKTAAKIMTDYPVFGIGCDTLGMVYPRYFKGQANINFENQNRIHNVMLEIVVTSGVVGLIAYIWFAGAWLRMILKGFLRSPAKGDSHLLLAGLTSGIVAYFVQNQFSFGHIPIIMLFWVFLGLTVVVCDRG